MASRKANNEEIAIAATLGKPNTPAAVHSHLVPKDSKGPYFAAMLPEAQGDYFMSFL